MPRHSFSTTIGWLTVSGTEDAVTGVSWGRTEAAAPSPLLQEAARQIQDYLAGKRRTFDLPLAPSGSAFQRRVWREMTRIPYGEVLTYGEMAARTGGVARAVGGACGANPIPIVIPCHRVVANAGLGGFSGGSGLETKRRLLILEGALAPELPL